MLPKKSTYGTATGLRSPRTLESFMPKTLSRLTVFLFFCATAAYGQTSGATAPEVTSFEPVDITDLVNLSSGDFTYSVPVMAVPGAPGGNYPFALSYKSGVLHGQEATWAGLGWNLQAGSVSRFVRSFPDDYRGALITNVETHRSVYNYSVGLGYQGFSIGVNWDNHGGFGGSVGYAYADGVGGSAGLRYHNKTGFGANVGISGSSQGFGGRLGYDTSGDFSASASFQAAEGGQVSLDSTGQVGFSSSKMPSATITNNSQRFGSYKTQNSQTGINVGIFNFGWGRSQTSRTDKSEAWGYIHWDQIGQSDNNVERRPLDLNTLGSFHTDPLYPVANPTAQQIQTYQERLEHYDLNQTFQRRERSDSVFGSDQALEQVGMALDSHYQDFKQAFSSNRTDAENVDAVSFNSVYSADYMTGSFDGYNIAAQGLSGMAKPVNKNIGYLSFSDNTSALRVSGGKWVFNPYRTLYRLLESGELGWDTDFEAYFAKQAWSDEDLDNMVLLNDPGLIQDQPFFSDNAGTNLPTDPRYKAFATRNQGTRMRYELDEDGKIARIIARKADGVTYVFGLLQDENGLTTAGARPNNLSETKYSRHTKNVNTRTAEVTQKEIQNEAYAYAWHLAAIISPDFVDQAPVGHYGPEDLGEYITFHYALTNPSYHWKTPYPLNDAADGDTPFALVGRSSFDDKFHFERSEGVKDFYHLRFAKTRTHMAVFEHDFSRRDNLSGVVNLANVATKTEASPYSEKVALQNHIQRDQLVYEAGHHFRSAHVAIKDPDLRQAFYDRFGNNLPVGVVNPQHYLLLFPTGTADKLGLDLNQTRDVTLVGTQIINTGRRPVNWSTNVSFLGNWNYGHHDVFQVNLDTSGVLPVFDINRFGFFSAMIVASTGAPEAHTFNGSVRLNAISLYRRDNDTNAMFDAGNQTTITSVSGLKAFTEETLAQRHISRTLFEHDYQLARGYQNVYSENPSARTQGKLTLKGVHFHAAGGDLPTGHPYLFNYYDHPSATTARDHYRKDPWGFPSLLSNPYASAVDNRDLNNLEPNSPPIQAADSLKSITTPVGTTISVEYDRDRYAWVQDRAAVNRLLDLNRQDFGPLLSSFERGNGAASEYQQPGGRPVDLNTIYGLLRDYQWAQPAAGDHSVWPFQVMIIAEGSSSQECDFIDLAGNCAEAANGNTSRANQHRFIIPVMSRPGGNLSLPIVQTGMNPDVFVAGHPAVHEFAAWIWHEIDHEDGDLLNFKIYGMPGQAFDPDGNGPLAAVTVPRETDYNAERLPELGGQVFVGEIAGGLRVKSLTTDARQASSPFGEEMVTTVEYDYTDPANGMDSGTIFADPKSFIHGVGGDRRIVRSEAYPYLHMPGAEVTYGTVTTQMVSGNRRAGFTRYTHHTARDPRVSMGVFNQAVREYPDSAPYKPNTGFHWTQNDADTQFLQLEHVGGSEAPWKFMPYNAGAPITFELDYQVRTRIVNNSGLIGLLAREERLDANHNLVSRTRRLFQAAYDPKREGLPVHRFYRGANGTLTGENFTANQRLGSLDPLMPGVHVEKNAALLIGRYDGDGEHFRVKALFQDEIWNSFHNLKTITEFYPQAGENRLFHYQEKETAALDFSTGDPSISFVKTLGSGGQPIYEYHWQVPAHEIWDPDGAEGGMKSLNMLTQPGFQLWARSDRAFQNNIAGDWFNVLNHSGTQVRGASTLHWRRNVVPGHNERWVQTAAMNYRGDETATQASGWWTMPAVASSGILADQYKDNHGGVWETAQQVTAYNRFGVPVEERDRLGNYTSKIYDPTGQQVIASFAGGRLDQVYYEGFDYLSNDPNQVYPPTYQANLDYQLFRIPESGPEPLSPEDYRAQRAYAYIGNGAARGQVPVTFVPNRRGESRNGQNLVREHFWLSFFVRRSGVESIPVQHGAGNTAVPMTATSPASGHGDLWVSEAQGGWYFVKMKLPFSAFGNIRIGEGNTLVDAITIVPAASGELLPPGSFSLFSYDPLHNQVSAMTDSSGRTTRYQFNRLGELFRVYDTDGNVITEHHRLPYRRESTP